MAHTIPPNAEVSRLINRTSFVTMALAAVLSPIPLADELAFIPVYGVLASRIGKHHGLATKDIPWKPIVATALAALGARAAINVTVSYIPGVAAIANAISAATVTQILGAYMDAACDAPEHARAMTMREIGDRIRDKLKARRAAF